MPKEDLLDTGGRVPPQAVEVEESVLGAMLIEQEALEIALDLIEADSFYLPANKHVFEVLQTLYEKNGKADLLTVEEELRDRALLDVVGGTGYLANLTRSVSSAANIGHHAMIIAEKAMKRNTILHCNEIIGLSYDSETDAVDVLDEWNRRLDRMDTSSGGKASLTPSEIRERDKDTPKSEKLLYGIRELDNGLYEFASRRGQVELTIADSGHGKTEFAKMKAKMLMRQGIHVAWFQLEEYDSTTAKSFEHLGPEYEDFIHICDSVYDIEEMKREARRLNRQFDLGYIVFDYVQKVETSAYRNKNEKVEHISDTIMKMAKDMNALVHPLSQVTMNYDTRHGWKREPNAGDARWSQALKMDAHIITTIFRPNVIEDLVVGNKQEYVKDWNGNYHPYRCVWVKQAKLRGGMISHARVQLIHTDQGLEVFRKEAGPVTREKSYASPKDENENSPF